MSIACKDYFPKVLSMKEALAAFSSTVSHSRVIVYKIICIVAVLFAFCPAEKALYCLFKPRAKFYKMHAAPFHHVQVC